MLPACFKDPNLVQQGCAIVRQLQEEKRIGEKSNPEMYKLSLITSFNSYYPTTQCNTKVSCFPRCVEGRFVHHHTGSLNQSECASGVVVEVETPVSISAGQLQVVAQLVPTQRTFNQSGLQCHECQFCKLNQSWVVGTTQEEPNKIVPKHNNSFTDQPCSGAGTSTTECEIQVRSQMLPMPLHVTKSYTEDQLHKDKHFL